MRKLINFHVLKHTKKTWRWFQCPGVFRCCSLKLDCQRHTGSRTCMVTCELVVQSTCYFAQRCLIPSEILFLILVTPFLFLCFYFFADEVLSDLARVRISSFCFYILQSDIYFQPIFKIKTNVQCKANMEKPIRPGKHKIIWPGGITPPSCKISWLLTTRIFFMRNWWKALVLNVS